MLNICNNNNVIASKDQTKNIVVNYNVKNV